MLFAAPVRAKGDLPASGEGPKRPGWIRTPLTTASALVAYGLGQRFPGWTDLPLMVWLMLMAVIYGVSIWLWAQGEPR